MLKESQLIAIKQLQKECEKADNIQLKLNWEMLREREGRKMDFFHEVNGELVAYLALFGFGTTVEVCGMVKPKERRKGYFTKLWQEALVSIEQYDFSTQLLNTPSSSTSAKEWLSSRSYSYAFSEYQMRWLEQPIEASDDVLIRKTKPSDANLEVKLDVLAFGMDEDDARTHLERIKERHDEQFLMIEADNRTVGKLRVNRIDGEAWIYGFAILPEFQGRGYGRKVLRNIVKSEHEAGNQICLEVEAKNARALILYESVGFVKVQGQDYYKKNRN
ncbi:GNAT family N-acetyltransferase [Sporosarcina sp. ANT_H38]|uniref:GNAT family N-acetyltransferase n=1 Tax=Sporosarcina sp. ANT_H38 TaxID=2597358 RepID=UPI0011F3AECD|nr:GNAT family N-acetyltransferase [Sporosarcina sp. ANT_H38]KAA0965914.1 GNAT family N-acetyltransferase [Sporosarcina sp. ANT_H38]